MSSHSMLKEVLVKPMPFNLSAVTAAPDAVNSRMLQHKAIIEAFGITSLSGLGTLTIRGNVIPQAGLTRPEPNVLGAETMFQSAFRADSMVQGLQRFVPAGGRAQLLKAIPFPTQGTAIPTIPVIPSPIVGPVSPVRNPFESLTETAASNIKPRTTAFSSEPLSDAASSAAMRSLTTVPVNSAYWAAQEVHLADNTTVILKNPQKYLIILAEKITVGKNVTFTWERPLIQKPAKRTKLSPPADRPMSTTLSGVTGVDGLPGVMGEPGWDGTDGPELEVWVLEMNGRPAFDLRGQDGTSGGDGQDGQAGGRGSKGRTGIKDGAGLWCASGAGAGGNGGRGGAAGRGGQGGEGGRGGKLSLYAPQAVINSYLQGFYVTVDGGEGGPGGIPGVPGPGGPGGAVGATVKAAFEECGPKNGRSAGQPGAQGTAGIAGPPGKDGGPQGEPVSMKVIDADEFRRKLLVPAIFSTAPTSAYIDDTVELDGKRFTKTDVVLVGGVQAQTLVYSDTKMQFKVPSLAGGSHSVQVRQSDNTLSNRGTIYVLPKLVSAKQSRVRPGGKVQLIGSGFTEKAMVKVDGLDMPDVHVLSPSQLEFTLVRPADVQPNPSGEKIRVKVMLPDGISTNDIVLVLETFHMLVIGDSIQWGQGLLEQEKFHSLVASAVQVREGGIGFYKTVLAHSGAIIGAGVTDIHPSLPGEVPTKFPTVLQQVDLFTDLPDHVDLVLVDGGMNDIDIRNVLNPHGPDLTPMAKQFFFDDMKTLLKKVGEKFKNARIIVTGYYQILSEHSNLLAVEAMLIALGVGVAGPGGGIVLGGIGALELNQIINRCKQVHDLSRKHLQEAVNAVNAMPVPVGGNRIFLADPNLGTSHAALTSDPYVYGIHPNLAPEDVHVAPSRNIECIAANQDGIDLEICRVASVGHPNPKGARAYADAIIPLL
ncbi:SGNH/GDSL hydrolase family protein [Paenibacillus spongiae]|uniref:SGNH/GDSL hydrolase family protein n=1 Tax=Paenibacillus spongiae TaxID=2909671 RepID=A0ABY5S1L3_9BACL|nr:SGNH/GDSL hydrolase family protein [Paenibacillus spongiae]UVI27440.1 SGNH/GDSL hydrolase family protein [Paenibacillus spongiae]